MLEQHRPFTRLNLESTDPARIPCSKQEAALGAGRALEFRVSPPSGRTLARRQRPEYGRWALYGEKYVLSGKCLYDSNMKTFMTGRLGRTCTHIITRKLTCIIICMNVHVNFQWVGGDAFQPSKVMAHTTRKVSHRCLVMTHLRLQTNCVLRAKSEAQEWRDTILERLQVRTDAARAHIPQRQGSPSHRLASTTKGF